MKQNGRVDADAPESFAVWLRRELDEREWGPEDVAWRAGVVPGTVRSWLAGIRQPEGFVRPALAAALGTAPDALPPRPPRRAGARAGTAPGFGAWLAAELAARGWSQTDFARRADIHPSSIAGWCAGRNAPRPDARARIAAALGVSEDAMPPRLPERRPRRPAP